MLPAPAARPRAALAALLLGAIGLVAAGEAPARTYPFTGRWDCGSGILALSPEAAEDARGVRQVKGIQEGSDDAFSFYFTDGSTLSVSDFAGDTMTLYERASDTSRTCRRVG